MHMRREFLMSLAIVAALPLAACGSDSSGSSPSVSSPGPSGGAAGAASASVASPPPGSSTPAAPASAAAVPSPAAKSPAATVPIPGAGPQKVDTASIPELVPGGGSPPVADACALVGAEQVQAIMGAPTAGQSQNLGNAALSTSVCSWGGLAEGHALMLQVLKPGTVADPGQILIPPSDIASADAPVPPGGKVWNGAVIGGETTPGVTWGWAVGGNQVILLYAGSDLENAKRDAILAAARTVNTNLGG